MISRMGVGFDHVDIVAARALGIIVTNTPGANAQTVAEHALALTMAASRGIGIADAQMHGGTWKAPRMRDLTGRTFGLIGFGNIARHYARLVAPLAGRILAYDAYQDEDIARALHVEYVSMDELLAQSDVLSLHIPLSDDTKGLIDRVRIAQMKPDAILINTSRGEVIDEAALCDALSHDRLFAAGLDVFCHEPLEQDSPLRGLDNCVMTPHCASLTPEAFQSMLRANIDSIEAHITGKGRLSQVN